VQQHPRPGAPVPNAAVGKPKLANPDYRSRINNDIQTTIKNL